jgi:hypothetical protein
VSLSLQLQVIKVIVPVIETVLFDVVVACGQAFGQ